MTSVSEQPNLRRRQTRTTLLLAVVLLTPALVGFGMKFIELFSLSRGEAEGWFALSPVVNYLLASIGFLCLFGWAAAHGMFRNMEEPKRHMLAIEGILDRQHADGNSHAAPRSTDSAPSQT
ncbi:MAG: hypothetical protein AB7O26_13815 [Planctomycetaceae bacterium]